MSVREYIGARYVPLFMGDWDNTESYEPLSVVQYQGNSYTSRQSVPTGIAIDNETYWVETGNYNAQIEAYRQEVTTYNSRISTLEGKFPIATASISDNAITTTKIADGNITTQKLNDSAVATDKIADGAITRDKMAQSLIGGLWNDTNAISGSNLVVFGDSYTAPNITNSIDAYWPKRLAAVYNLTLFNYAIAGAGFGRAAQPISAQQTNCASDMTTTQANETSIVVCMAGCNDLLNDIAVGDINNGITGFINWASAFFPNAKIFVIPYNWGFSKLTIKHNYTITNSMNSIMTYNKARIHIIPYAWCWNLGVASRFQNEVHPNQTGYNHITSHIMNAIEGSECSNFGVGSNLDLSNITGINSGHFNYNVRNGILYINGYLRPTSQGSGQIILFAAGAGPAIVTPKDSLRVLGLHDTTNGKEVGTLTIDANGRIHAFLTSDASANDVCNFNGSFLPEVGCNWSDYV